jgi:hypothetical protein
MFENEIILKEQLARCVFQFSVDRKLAAKRGITSPQKNFV